jgi:hypothetical protein
MSTSPFFQNSHGIEKVKDILSTIQTTADNFPSDDPAKQAMYIQGLGLWAQDLQEAIEELNGTSTTNTTTTK